MLTAAASAAADSRFEVNEIMVGPDKAVVTGHQIVTSHLKSMTDQVSMHSVPHQLQHLVTEFLPALTEARVPTTIQLRFGKSDAGKSYDSYSCTVTVRDYSLQLQLPLSTVQM